MVDAEQFADVVAAAIESATAPLLARVSALERSKALGLEQLADVRRENEALRLELVTLKAARVEPDVDAIATKAASLLPAPRDGRDASVDFEALAAKAASLVPRPQDGRDAPPVDLDVLAAKVASLMPKARDGKDAEPIDMDAVVAKAAALVPRPRDGKDAEPVDLDVVAQKAAALVPVPKDGRDAPPFDVEAIALKAAMLVPAPKDGKDAPPVDVDQIAKQAAALVTVPKPEPVDVELIARKAAALIPAPQNGKDAPPVDLEAVAQKAASLVRAPKDGRDGVGLTGALLDREGRLVLTLSDGTTKDVGSVVGRDGADVDMGEVTKAIAAEVAKIPRPADGKDGKDGRDGKDGADGLSFEDFDMVFDEADGTVSYKAVGAGREKSLIVPAAVYRGLWDAAKTYRMGQSVSQSGSTWICAVKQTKGVKPDDTPESKRVWRLAAQRGGNGPRGPQGPPGKDMRWEPSGDE